jgi:SAM-dependent methyltransferase
VKTAPGSPLPACPVCSAWAARAGVKAGYNFFRCKGCRLLFVWPTPDNCLGIYSDDYFSGAVKGHGYVDYDSDKLPMVPTFERYLDRFAQYGVSSGRLLDVGAASGFFLNLARRRGYDTHGVEVSPYAAGLARSRGLNVFTGMLETADYSPGFFDVMTMLDVIEHMVDPASAMERARLLLRAGGLLAINTPDSGSFLARTLGMQWHMVLPPEHVCLFHRDSLRYLLEKAGFEVLLVTTIGKRFTAQYVAHIIATWRQARLWKRLSRALQNSSVGRLGMSINLRDNVFMLAKKRRPA